MKIEASCIVVVLLCLCLACLFVCFCVLIPLMDAFDDDDDDDAVLSLQFLMVLSTIISAGIAQYGARQCPFESR